MCNGRDPSGKSGQSRRRAGRRRLRQAEPGLLPPFTARTHGPCAPRLPNSLCASVPGPCGGSRNVGVMLALLCCCLHTPLATRCRRCWWCQLIPSTLKMQMRPDARPVEFAAALFAALSCLPSCVSPPSDLQSWALSLASCSLDVDAPSLARRAGKTDGGRERGSKRLPCAGSDSADGRRIAPPAQHAPARRTGRRAPGIAAGDAGHRRGC